MSFSNLVGIQADRIFTRLGFNAISIRYGESKVLSPNPIVTPQGIQSDTPVSSDLTLQGQSYETYAVSIPLATLKAKGINIAAMSANSIWYLNRNDGLGWRRCRTWGTPDFNQIGKYGVTLKELGANDYGD